MDTIIELELTLQSLVSPRARKNIVRRGSPEGSYRNRKFAMPVSIPIGPDSGANLIVRKFVARQIKRHAAKGDILFYVTAKFKSSRPEISDYFKTIVPRSEIPLPLRRV